MVKRVIKVVLFFPLGLISVFIEMPIEVVKWVITGKWSYDTIIEKFMEW